MSQQGIRSRQRRDIEADTSADSRLVAGRRRLQRDLETLQRPVTERCPADIVDLAAAALEREALAERAESLRARRAALERAEERFTKGLYGHFEVCGDAISEDRLEILPTTDHCRHHAGRR